MIQHSLRIAALGVASQVLLADHALAHEGHGITSAATSSGWLHTIVEPQHAGIVLSLFIASAVSVAVARAIRTRATSSTR